MFLRAIRSFVLFDKSIKLSGSRFTRFISQTSINPNESRSPSVVRPNKTANSKTSADAPSMTLSVLKRIPRKKRMWNATTNSNQREEQYLNVSAFATADWYDLDRLKQRFLSSSGPFQLVPIPEVINDVLCIQIQPTTNTDKTTASEAFIFDDGAVVFWNVQQDDEKLILNEVNKKNVSDNRYPMELVNTEKEIMNFIEVNTTSTLNNDIIRLNRQSLTEQILDKYTFSNALALSVKLGIWEALLDDEVEFVADLANRLKQDKHIKIEHGLMQRKSGELYSLKHAVNLSHDFLDTPDFYWSNSRLESLYKKVFNYFTIAKRTKVLNERLTFSLELVSVIEASLNEKKHVRLEWIIIILIGVEVFFNIIDHLDFFTPHFTPKHAKSSDDRR